MGTEDAMQTDLLPGIPQKVGFEKIFKATDVFCRYAFANPVSYPTLVSTATIMNDDMHFYPLSLSQTKDQILFLE